MGPTMDAWDAACCGGAIGMYKRRCRVIGERKRRALRLQQTNKAIRKNNIMRTNKASAKTQINQNKSTEGCPSWFAARSLSIGILTSWKNKPPNVMLHAQPVEIPTHFRKLQGMPH